MVVRPNEVTVNEELKALLKDEDDSLTPPIVDDTNKVVRGRWLCIDTFRDEETADTDHVESSATNNASNVINDNKIDNKIELAMVGK